MASKKDMVNAASAESGVSKKDTEKVLNAAFDYIMNTVGNGETVQIIGFGTFKSTERAERQCKNPATGEDMVSPAKRVPSFKAGATFKDIVKD